ncbi:methyltransferase family protein [Segnochrobactrum spirostomi]|uniref:Isoprenylcysteine carboxylmethyltransferase family protein n=1 Tax=Segnochrobactrum spirostomi TaxID=2608987 RepID=A0A6A7Y052_9HYPH|nr:isoprenylcysteine carboxylmethyltransferase family protein [Segnochrobactrum spirostomi]MQT11202.1 isoprenylcysteine carboxylmethyltransferase family protein [Segnochrobactrum spirostomi]
MIPAFLLPLMWLAWVVSWTFAARWSSAARRTESLRTSLWYRALLVVGALLIIVPGAAGWVPRLWPTPPAAMAVIDLVAFAGFAFCWWARLHLGRLWSASVTIKADHRVVDSGPYGLVRHPIYTGVILALLASVAASATLPAIVGGVVMIAGFTVKARLEEALLRAELGAAAYDAYAARVPMLVPFAPR